MKDFLPQDSDLTFPAILKDESSLSVLFKLTAVTNHHANAKAKAKLLLLATYPGRKPLRPGFKASCLSDFQEPLSNWLGM